MAHLLADLARPHPERIAIAPDLTYGAVAARAARLAEGLDALGLTGRHRIATLLPDAADTLIALVTVMERASVLPLNPALTPTELATLAREAGVDGVLARPGDAVAAGLGLPVISMAPDGVVRGDALGPPRAARAPGLVLLTSGSTGRPKRVPLSLEACLGSARQIARTLHLGPQDVALHALPMFHIGAVVDLCLAPLCAGGALRIADGPGPQDLLGAVRAGASWMQLVPTMLARCLAELTPAEGAEIGARLRFIRSVSSDLAPAQQAAAEDFFAATPLIQMYGMTETAGQIASNPLPPQQRKPGSVGQAAGAEILICDPSGSPVPPGQEGEICVRGPHVMAGYEAGGSAQDRFGDWLRSGDLGHLDSDGFLFLTGRRKEIINRGGEKIAPVEIERAALALDGIAEAAAFAEPHPTLGEQPALAVVAQPGSALDEAAILAGLAPVLAEFKRPRRVQILAALPRLGSGKIDKRRLAERRDIAAPAAIWTGEAARIAAIWREVLGTGAAPDADEDFFDAGGDSLIATRFVTDLQAALGRAVPPNALFEAPRFGDFVARLADSAPISAEPDHIAFLRGQVAGWPGRDLGDSAPVRALNAVADGPPLFYCSQGETEGLIAAMAGARPLYLMRSLLGYGPREAHHNTDLAERYAEEIGRLQPSGPVYLAGFCEGARILAMTADILIARGRRIGALAAIDHWFERPTAYPVLHGFTRSRRHSALMRFGAPELGFGALHPEGAEAVHLPGKHVQAMTAGGMAPLVARLAAVMDGSAPLALPPASSAPEPRSAACRARITVRSPRLAERAGRLPVMLRVQNSSAHPWAESPRSGLSVVLHWRNFDGSVVISVAGHALLEAPLAPGETAELACEVRVPDQAVPSLLCARLVDQGFAAYAAANRRGASRLVWPR